MGIYIFTWEVLKKYLEEDEADPNSDNDFGKNIIPAMLKRRERCWLTALRATGRTWAPSTPCGKPIWICCPRLPGLNLLDKKWPIYGRTPTCPPTFIGKRATWATAPWPRAAPFWAR